MKIVLLKDPDYRTQLDMLVRRPAVPPEIERTVAEILADVRENGDDALCRFLEKIDKVKLAPEQFRVTDKEIREAEKSASPAARRAISLALKNIQTFARLTKPVSWRKEVRPGENSRQEQDHAAAEPDRPGRDEELCDLRPDARTGLVRDVAERVSLRAERDELEDLRPRKHAPQRMARLVARHARCDEIVVCSTEQPAPVAADELAYEP